MTNYKSPIKPYEAALGDGTVGGQQTSIQCQEYDSPEVHNEKDLCTPIQTTSGSSNDSRSILENGSLDSRQLKSSFTEGNVNITGHDGKFKGSYIYIAGYIRLHDI